MSKSSEFVARLRDIMAFCVEHQCVECPFYRRFWDGGYACLFEALPAEYDETKEADWLRALEQVEKWNENKERCDAVVEEFMSGLILVPTKRQMDAIRIIGDRTISASRFAEKFWPDSSMHTAHSRGGNGTQVGKIAWLCGGSYLAKLAKRGWVDVNHSNGPTCYRLTAEGRRILEGESL